MSQMKISELIKHLQKIKKKRGDIRCFTTDSNSGWDSVYLTENLIIDGPAHFAISDDVAKYISNKNEEVLFIGG